MVRKHWTGDGMKDREPNWELFDWSAIVPATKHGVSVFDIEDAFLDPKRVFFSPSLANKRGKRYESDERKGLLARGSSGRQLHILFVVESGRIKVFHARDFNPSERRSAKKRAKKKS